jgi:hypothetical protein
MVTPEQVARKALAFPSKLDWNESGRLVRCRCLYRLVFHFVWSRKVDELFLYAFTLFSVPTGTALCVILHPNAGVTVVVVDRAAGG